MLTFILFFENIPYEIKSIATLKVLELSFFNTALLISSYLGDWLYKVVGEFGKKFDFFLTF